MVHHPDKQAKADNDKSQSQIYFALKGPSCNESRKKTHYYVTIKVYIRSRPQRGNRIKQAKGRGVSVQALFKPGSYDQIPHWVEILRACGNDSFHRRLLQN